VKPALTPIRMMRWRMIVVALLVLFLTGLLFRQSYLGIKREELALWSNASEKIYAQFQTNVSELLQEEDKRSVFAYRYYQSTFLDVFSQEVVTVSPLANTIKQQEDQGIIAYFQISPDSTVSSPYLSKQKIPALNVVNNASKQDKTQQLKRDEQAQLMAQKLLAFFKSNSESTISNVSKSLREQKPQPEKPIKTNVVTQESSPVNALPKGVYPLPLKRLTKDQEPVKDDENKAQFAPSASQLNLFETQTFKKISSVNDLNTTSKDEDKSRKIVSKEKQKSPSVNSAKTEKSKFVQASVKKLSITPFEGILLSDERVIIFYRKVLLGNQIYTQGFAVYADVFFRRFLQTLLANESIFKFARLKLMVAHQPLLQFGKSLDSHVRKISVFKRMMGYPLEHLNFVIEAEHIPRSQLMIYFWLQSGVLCVVILVGFYSVYHSVNNALLLSQKRQDFVSSVSHELRTPLTSIRMYADMLLLGVASDNEQQQEKYAHRIVRESERLSRLIDNVLRFAGLEKNTVRLNLKVDDPRQDIMQILEEAKTMPQLQAFKITFNHHHVAAVIQYDPEFLKQIFLILIDNSVKFSRPHDRLEIQVDLQSSLHVFHILISDFGPGVDSSLYQKIFEQFYRIENELTRHTQGTGIGLSMAQLLMQKMNAKIVAMPRPDGLLGLTIDLIFNLYP